MAVSHAQLRGRETIIKRKYVFFQLLFARIWQMDILGLLPKRKSRNQHVIVLTDRHTKLTRAIYVTTVPSPIALAVIVDNWVIPYGILTYLLTDTGPQFMPKIIAVATVCLDVKHLTTTAFHLQTNF